MSSPSERAQKRSDDNSYVKTTEGRRQWHQVEGDIRISFSADLADEYLLGVPRSITDKVFAMAWDEGHSSGYQEVENYYGEYADLVDLIMKEIQK